MRAVFFCFTILNCTANRLSGTTYGNGDSVSYTYDYLDRLESVLYNDIDVKVTYTYDYMSALVCSEVTNIAGDVELATYNYEYDSLGRLVRFYETLGSRVKQQSECSYDSKNRISSYDWYDGAEMHSVTYTYNEENGGLLEKYDYGEDGAIGLRYDSLNRMNIRYQRHSTAASDFWGTYYTYQNGESSAQTTSLVSQIKHQFSADDLDDSYTLDYTYDNLGNITEVKANGEVTAKYVYDKQGQLWLEGVYPENESPYTLIYYYDTYGNIVQVRKYLGAGYSAPWEAVAFGTLLDTKEYTYSDSEWADKLTAYEGVQFTYDEIGNPLTYYNGNDYEFTWENGRQLSSALVNDEDLLTFTYNADGIRTSKTLRGEYTEKYLLDGDKVVEIVRQGFEVDDRCVITYDESGNPFSLEYYSSQTDTIPNKYYYVLNNQGDVIQLRTADGTVIANYTYDAWGKPVSVTGTNFIANRNPIRYRGYFYDTETGLYYCNSRYYDPEVKRWINADAFMSTGQGFLGHNMFAYCQNNPVMYVDFGGYLAIVIIGPDGDSSEVINLVGTYKDLIKLARGTGLEVHHLIEKRFWKTVPELKNQFSSTRTMPSVIVDSKLHAYYTREFRKEFPYGNGTKKR